jgi:hypothetical protein
MVMGLVTMADGEVPMGVTPGAMGVTPVAGGAIPVAGAIPAIMVIPMGWHLLRDLGSSRRPGCLSRGGEIPLPIVKRRR